MTDAQLVARALSDARVSGNGWARGTCPFCLARLGKPDRRRSFGIKPSTGAYHCFRCSASGRVRDMVATWDHEEAPPKTDDASRPPEGFVFLTSTDGLGAMCFKEARDYLDGRGIERSKWRDAGIGATASGRHAGRVVVPILADDGVTWIGWVGRAWTKQSPQPYLYPSGMPRGVVLYNHRVLLEETDVPVYVVEGVFDVLALWPNAVALLGKPSPWQVEALAHAKRPVVVVLDGDAHDEGWALSYQLRLRGQRSGSIKLPPRKDPDEVPRAWLDEEGARCLG